MEEVLWIFDVRFDQVIGVIGTGFQVLKLATRILTIAGAEEVLPSKGDLRRLTFLNERFEVTSIILSFYFHRAFAVGAAIFLHILQRISDVLEIDWSYVAPEVATVFIF